MKLAKAMTVTLLSATLGACALSIDGGGHSYKGHYDDQVSVKLPNGKRAEFSCPRGTESFVSRSNNGTDIIYGCRTRGTAAPVISN